MIELRQGRGPKFDKYYTGMWGKADTFDLKKKNVYNSGTNSSIQLRLVALQKKKALTGTNDLDSSMNE